ncbi:hypothetical protein A28LD_1604 [Idiomarina sp. A28L]|uniref:Ig-like domain-containing protein n=1 Tax=Idiomarina sp. A28L TaxID=1036674 RepID=UPI0002138C3A|nr:tandem-95 repeat protein [Idiomarina sp. A28L]EGN74591.1 hypothetical protein A28LD_1604 [Idiomarina sp. A28L]
MLLRICLFFLLFVSASAQADYVVSGAPTAYGPDYNGLYVEAGERGGKPYYKHSSVELFLSFTGIWVLSSYPDMPWGDFENYSDAELPPETGWRGMPGAENIRVTIAGPALQYSAAKFLESLNNDGSLTGHISITHNQFDEQGFAGVADENFIESGKVLVGNVPDGLTAVVRYVSPSELNFTFVGVAVNSAQINNINSISVEFMDSAFAGINASAALTNSASVSDIAINFRDELFVAASGADYTSIQAALNAAKSYDIITLAAETFTEPNITVTKNIVIRGAGARKTIVQAQTDDLLLSARVFSVHSGLDMVIFTDLTVKNGLQTGVGARGAGVHALSPVIFENCRITNNTIKGSGNLWGAGLDGLMGASLRNCLVDNNQINSAGSNVYFSGGAGISFQGSFHIENTTITNNHHSIDSGAVSNQLYGAGIFSRNQGNGFIVNSTITNNTTNGSGGGIAVQLMSGELRITNSILFGNAAGFNAASGDLWSEVGDVVFESSILGELFYTSAGASVEHSRSLYTDPALDVLADNGGQLQTHALLAGSPAIGAGIVDALVPDLDQRGFSRSGAPDIGAHQYDATEPYYVTYDANGGVADNVPVLGHSLSVGKSFTVSAQGALSNGDLDFFGWNTEPSGAGTNYSAGSVVVMQDSDLTLYAQWEPVVVITLYSLNYSSAGNGSIAGAVDQEVASGASGTSVEAVPALGYSFVSWSDGLETATRQDTNVAFNIAVQANFEINQYAVNFVVNGVITETQTVAHGGAAAIPNTPVVPGYTFTGWDRSFNEVVGDLTVTAVFAINSFTVTFVDHDGAVLKTESVAYGSGASAPSVPTRTGYNFSGWDRGFSNITADITVTAAYSINSFTVTFDLKGGVRTGGGELVQGVQYGANALKPEFDAPEGRVFIAWDRRFENVTENITVSASYRLLPTGENISAELNQDDDAVIVPSIAGEPGAVLNLVVVTPPTNGTLSDTEQGWAYTPNERFSGFDEFEYYVQDGEFKSATYRVDIAVYWVNSAPVAVDDGFSLERSSDDTYSLPVLLNDYDADEEALTLITAQTNVGSVSIDSGALYFKAPENFVGQVNLSYVISDESDTTASALVALTITGEPDGDAPRIEASSFVRVNATGLQTRVNLGTASAIDVDGRSIPVALVEGNNLFEPGEHIVFWRAIDSAGRESTVSQQVWVDPMISLSRGQTVGPSGSAFIRIFLNGNSPEYPVAVPYTVVGTALPSSHSLKDGVAYIDEGLETHIEFEIHDSLNGENEQSIVVVLSPDLNRGAVDRSTILVSPQPVVPSTRLSAFQDDEPRLIVAKNAGMVEIRGQRETAQIDHELNHTWITEIDGVAANNELVFSFDPINVASGIHKISLLTSLSDNAIGNHEAFVFIDVRDVLPVLGDSDSNGNGIPDRLIGLGDANNNGIPDFLDGMRSCNVISQQILQRNSYLAEIEPGVCISRGRVAMESSLGAIQLAPDASSHLVELDDEFKNVGGVFDFIITNIPEAGESVYVVVPQQNVIPSGAVYRKYIDGVWQDFVVDEHNRVFSASGEPGVCPPPAGAQWQPGLTEGHHCVQLYIQDGGPNDADGKINGNILDPGGVAVIAGDNTPPRASDLSVSMVWNQSLSIYVLESAIDDDGDDLRLLSATADIGEADIVDGEFLRYTPPRGFGGITTIAYSIGDGFGGVASAQISVDILGNAPPVAVNDVASTDDQTPIIIDVLANDHDPEGTLNTVVAAVAEQGQVVVLADNRLRYTPRVGFGGTDIIRYTIEDELGAQASAEVSVSVLVMETISIQQKASKGSWSLILMPFVLLIWLNRQPALMGFLRRAVKRGQMNTFVVGAILATSMATSLVYVQPVYAGDSSSAGMMNWEVELAGGTSTTKDSRARIESLLPENSRIERYKGRDYAFMLHFSYQIAPNLHAKGGYVDLGSANVDLLVNTTTSQATFEELAGTVPILGSGFTIGLAKRFDISRKWQIGAEVGMLDWKASTRSASSTGATIKTEYTGIDPYYGVSLGFRFTDAVSLRVQWNHFQMKRSVDAFTVGVRYQF